MQAGDYREAFSIVRRDYKVNAKGDSKPHDTVIYSGYAKVVNLSGREYWEAMAVHAESTLKFHTRWHRSMEGLDTTQCYLRWRNRELDIVSLDNIEYRNALCTIRAKERTHG